MLCFVWPEVVVLTRIWKCRLVTNGTVDESIFKIAQQKLVLDAAVLEGGDSSSEHNDGDARTMGEILSALLAVPPPSWGSRLRKALHYTDLKLSQGSSFGADWSPENIASRLQYVQCRPWCSLIIFFHLLQAYSYSKPCSKLTCLRIFPQLYHCIRLNFVIVQICSLLQTEVGNLTSWIIYILSQDNVLGRHPHTYYSHLPSRCICLGSSPLCRRSSLRGGLTGCSLPSLCSPENFFITVCLLGVHSLCLFTGTGLKTWGGLSWYLWMSCISPRFILRHVPVVQQGVLN